jgi:hypothetical protein
MMELEYFLEYGDLSEDARDEYVAAELRRLVADGRPLLTSILRVPDDEAKSRALELLTANVTAVGDVVFDVAPSQFKLKLAEGVTPPDKDPQARPLPASKKGNVLVVKLGNRGGRIPEKATGKQVEMFSGKRRQILVSGGADLYELAEVGRTAKPFPLRAATLILRTWGVGVQTQRCLTHMGRDGEIVEGQSFYLVDEEPQPRELGAEPEASKSNTKKKPARKAA